MRNPASPPGPSREARLTAATDVLLLSAAFALTAGMLFAGYELTRRFAFGRLTWYSRDIFWMAPLAYLGVFLIPAVVLAGIALALPSARVRRLAVWIFSFLAGLSLLLPIEQLTPMAAAILAAGVAVQFARSCAATRVRWRRLLPRFVLGLALAIGAGGVGSQLWRALRARRQLSGPAAPAGSPNVLLLVFDTVRRRDVSLYGYARETTPRLRAWASGGAVFDDAIATAPWTLPSHGALLTGELPRQLGGGAFDRVLPSSATSLAELLRDRGYRTGGFVANMLYTSYETGLSRGFSWWDGHPQRYALRTILLNCPLAQTGLFLRISRARSLAALRDAVQSLELRRSLYPADGYKPAARVVDGFLAWQGLTGDRPFFALLNFNDAHAPYHAPEAYRTKFRGPRKEIDAYDAAIAYLDAEVDRLLGELARRGVLDRTVVVLTADHGEQFGAHGLTGHANSLYLNLLAVPLVLRFPGKVPAGVRIDVPVSLRDVPATILDLVGAPAALPGHSLARFWRPEEPVPASSAVATLAQDRRLGPEFPNALTGMESLIDGSLHYIRDELGDERLYVYRRDSLEEHNLARSAAWRPTLAALRHSLDRALGEASPGRANLP